MPESGALKVLSLITRAILLCAILFAAVTTFATLGEDVSSVRSDQLQTNARLRIVNGPAYSVHELSSPSGTTIREFVSPSGTVFGVSWQGSFTPDLRQLLGTHFQEYLQASQSAPGRPARMVHVESGDLVVESAGHMRFSVGRAYLRNKMPEGVTSDALR
jgi:hypothetical protein